MEVLNLEIISLLQDAMLDSDYSHSDTSIFSNCEAKLDSSIGALGILDASLTDSFMVVDLEMEPFVVASFEDVLYNIPIDFEIELIEQAMFFKTLNNRHLAGEINEQDFIWFID